MRPAPSQLIQDLDVIANLRFDSTTSISRTACGVATSASRPIGGVVEASLEADGAERGKTVRYADAEANVVPPDATFLVSSDCGTLFQAPSRRPEAPGSLPETGAALGSDE